MMHFLAWHEPSLGCLAASERRVGQPFAEHVRRRHDEARAVVHLAMVKTKCLFVQIAEQVERLHAYVDALDRALQQGTSNSPCRSCARCRPRICARGLRLCE